MSNHDESLAPLYEPLEPSIENNVAEAARLLNEVGIDLYALVPDLKRLVRIASGSGEPLDDVYDPSRDPISHAAQLLIDAGEDIYSPMSHLDYLLHEPSRSSEHSMTIEEMEALVGDDDFEDMSDEELKLTQEINSRKMFDLMCNSYPCEHPEHND